MRTISAAVAIPAHNEAALLPRCLQALAAQREAPDFAVIIFANNCTDNTADVARGMAGELPFQLDVEEATLPPDERNAGHARRRAMARAQLHAQRPGFVLLGTDADAEPAEDWVATMLAHIRGGVDAVAGRAIIDQTNAEELHPLVRLRSRREAHLARLVDRITSLIDPLPWDPWPRHAGHWGANFAVTADALKRSGGIPKVPVAEDRAFFRELERINARIRHADDSRVMVSARLEGRAPGGMADVLRRRSEEEDPLCDAALEPLSHALRRCRLRRELRANLAILQESKTHARLGLPLGQVQPLFKMDNFGEVWSTLLKISPALGEVRLSIHLLSSELARAGRLLRRLAPDEVSIQETLEESLV